MNDEQRPAKNAAATTTDAKPTGSGAMRHVARTVEGACHRFCGSWLEEAK